MTMQYCRTKFPKSCIIFAENWIKYFDRKTPVKSRGNLDSSLVGVSECSWVLVGTHVSSANS